MTCTDCNQSHTYNMACIDCVARHCRAMFYPDGMSRWEYVKLVAVKYGFEPRALAEKVKGASK